MRILTRDRVLFTGQHLCPELDHPQGPLPDKLKVLLCLVDGAERRQQLQSKLASKPSPKLSDPSVRPMVKR